MKSSRQFNLYLYCYFIIIFLYPSISHAQRFEPVLSKYIAGNNIIVSVIDTGADIKHHLIKDHLWTNTGEMGIDSNGLNKSFNGVDDDKNGFTDDVHGWNFPASNPNVFDENGHGTHVSGIIIQNSNFIQPQQKPLSNIKLMILKYYSDKLPGKNNVANTIKAIEYSITMGAHIINYSSGGTTYSMAEKLVIDKARRKGILVITAAGNHGVDIDKKGYYPASYPLNNIVSVAAINSTHKLIRSSNFGKKSVDISAPGTYIYSSLPGQKMGYMSGTSQATAFVTSQIAAYFSKHINHSPIKTKTELLRHIGRKSQNLHQHTKSGIYIHHERKNHENI